jgi:hypothetical protein
MSNGAALLHIPFDLVPPAGAFRSAAFGQVLSQGWKMEEAGVTELQRRRQEPETHPAVDRAL